MINVNTPLPPLRKGCQGGDSCRTLSTGVRRCLDFTGDGFLDTRLSPERIEDKCARLCVNCEAVCIFPTLRLSAR